MHMLDARAEPEETCIGLQYTWTLGTCTLKEGGRARSLGPCKRPQMLSLRYLRRRLGACQLSSVWRSTQSTYTSLWILLPGWGLVEAADSGCRPNLAYWWLKASVLLRPNVKHNPQACLPQKNSSAYVLECGVYIQDMYDIYMYVFRRVCIHPYLNKFEQTVSWVTHTNTHTIIRLTCMRTRAHWMTDTSAQNKCLHMCVRMYVWMLKLEDAGITAFVTQMHLFAYVCTYLCMCATKIAFLY